MSKPELVRRVTVKCKNDFCTNLVTTIVGDAGNKYCEECRREADVINDRNYYQRNRAAIRKRKNAAARERYAKMKDESRTNPADP